MNLMITKGEKGFPGVVAEQVEDKHFRDFMPQPSEDTVLFLAGTTPQVKQLRAIAEKLGYKYII